MKYGLSLLFVCGCSSAHGDFGTSSDGGVEAEAAPPSACTLGYPQGPYGTAAGKVVNPGLMWQGYVAGSSVVSQVSPNDLFDCDGSKGINALVFDVSAEWCAACQSQAANMNALTAQDDALGIHIVTLMVQDASQAPATTATAEKWKQQYGLNDVAVCADPAFAFAPIGSTSISLPMTIIVDPRTMTIVKVKEGYLAAYPVAPDAEAVALAKKNGAP